MILFKKRSVNLEANYNRLKYNINSLRIHQCWSVSVSYDLLSGHTHMRTHTHTHARAHTHAHTRTQTYARTRTHTPPRAELTKKTTHDCIWKYWIFIDNRCYLIKDEFLKVYTAVVPIKLNLKKYVTWWLQSTYRWNKLALHRILNSLKLHIMTIFN